MRRTPAIAAHLRRDRITLYMEVLKLNVAVSRLRSRVGIALAVLAAAIAAAVLLNHSAAPSVADQNPNNTLCKGHVTKGKADPDDPDSGVVEYTFACSQAITGYSVLPDKAATGVRDRGLRRRSRDRRTSSPPTPSRATASSPAGASTAPAPTPACGTRSPQTFTIDGDVCAEPRVDPLLVVTFATATGGKATQYIAGPFDLGRPRGCPKSPRGGKTRIPADTTEPTTGDVAPIQ